MTRPLMLLLCLAAPVTAQEQAVSPETEAVVRDLEIARDKRVAELEKAVKDLRTARMNAREKARRLNELQAQLRKAKSPGAMEFGQLKYPVDVGSFGELKDAVDVRSGMPDVFVVVRQVINEREAIVELSWGDDVNEVVQIGGGAATADNSYVRTRPKIIAEATCWLLNVPTTKMVDDQMVKLPQTFYVSGTKQYTTTDGATKTVPVLQPVDLNEVHRASKARKSK